MEYKKEIYQGVEYHYPNTFQNAEDYLESINTDEKIDQQVIEQLKWSDIRQKRDMLITATDWMLMPDSPLTDDEKSSIKTYRQALRNIPQKCTDADQVVWPDKPKITKATAAS